MMECVWDMHRLGDACFFITLFMLLCSMLFLLCFFLSILIWGGDGYGGLWFLWVVV